MSYELQKQVGQFIWRVEMEESGRSFGNDMIYELRFGIYDFFVREKTSTITSFLLSERDLKMQGEYWQWKKS
jgi:hypothetical protein